MEQDSSDYTRFRASALYREIVDTVMEREERRHPRAPNHRLAVYIASQWEKALEEGFRHFQVQESKA